MPTAATSPSEVITKLETKLQDVTDELNDLTSRQTHLSAELKDLEKSLGDARKTVAQFGQTVDATEDAQSSAENYIKAMAKKFEGDADKGIENRVKEVINKIGNNIDRKTSDLTSTVQVKDGLDKTLKVKQTASDNADTALAKLGKLSDARKNAQGELDQLKKQFEELRDGGYRASAWFLLGEMKSLLASDACSKSKEDFRKDMDSSWQARRDAQSALADATAKQKAAVEEVAKAQKALDDAKSKRRSSIIACLKTGATEPPENKAAAVKRAP